MTNWLWANWIIPTTLARLLLPNGLRNQLALCSLLKKTQCGQSFHLCFAPNQVFAPNKHFVPTFRGLHQARAIWVRFFGSHHSHIREPCMLKFFVFGCFNTQDCALWPKSGTSHFAWVLTWNPCNGAERAHVTETQIPCWKRMKFSQQHARGSALTSFIES